jgi:hypothetical protein
VAHPVSGDVRANCENVKGFLRWLTEVDPTRIYIAPWLGEVEAHLYLDPIPADFYDRVLSDDEDVVRRLDGICLTGVGYDARWYRPNGTLKSTGMTREIAANALAGGMLIDLSQYRTAAEADDAMVTQWGDIQGLEARTWMGGMFIRDHLIRPNGTAAKEYLR